MATTTVVVNGGQAIITNRMAGAGTEPKNIGWGTGAGTAAVADTTLSTEVAVDGTGAGARTVGTSSRVTTTVTNDTYQVAGTVTATASIAVTNAGLWDNATIGSGSLHMHASFSVINVDSGDSIAFTFKEKFA